MKSIRFRRLLVLLAGSVVLVGSTFGGSVLAATSDSSVANSMKVSPLRTDLTIKPGYADTTSVFITNLKDTSVTLQAIENDFVAGDEKGTPAIILDQNSYAPTHSLKRFMEPIKDFTVAPHATAEVKLTINVPPTAQAGGYFGALRFASATSENKQLSLGSSVASLVLLTVPGATVEQLQLTNFDIQQNGTTGSNFRKPNNLSVLVRFQNKGNLQEAPFGQIQVQKGKKLVYSYNFNQQDPKDEILPDSSRRWEVPLKNLGKFGKYTVSGTFGYGSGGQTIQVSKTVWIVPTAYIIGVVGGVLLLILLIVITRLFLKGYKRRVLRSSHRRY
jgi:hypothetical protein